MSYQVANLGYKMYYDWDRNSRIVDYRNSLARQQGWDRAINNGEMCVKGMAKHLPRKAPLDGQMGYGYNSHQPFYGLASSHYKGGIITTERRGISQSNKIDRWHLPPGTKNFYTVDDNVINLYKKFMKKSADNLKSTDQMIDPQLRWKHKSDKYIVK